jgi:hypothetical protein
VNAQLPQLAGEIAKAIARDIEPDTWLPLRKGADAIQHGDERTAARFGYALAAAISEALRSAGPPARRLDPATVFIEVSPQEK